MFGTLFSSGPDEISSLSFGDEGQALLNVNKQQVVVTSHSDEQTLQNIFN